MELPIHNNLPFFSSYKELVKIKYETELYIAAKYNNSKMLEAKWTRSELQLVRYIGVSPIKEKNKL